MNRHFKLIKDALRRGFKWNSLWVIIATATTIIAMITVLSITLVINSRYNQLINETTHRNNSQIVENVSKSIDGYLEEMINVSDSLSELLEHNGGVTDSKQTEPFILRSDINTIAAFDSNVAAVRLL
jgi:two-component system sensor histidine kinase YesM